MISLLMDDLQNKNLNTTNDNLKSFSNFQPYNDNGGNIVAIAGDDFVVIGSDTRLTNGYSIYTRNQPKLFKITNKTVFGLGGCWCDASAFKKILEMKVKMYKYDHNKNISCESAAQLISTMLYSRRFFPYYVNIIVAGIDENGKGCVYSYDPVGSYQECKYRAAGNSSPIIQPILDNQVGKKNIDGLLAEEMKLSLEEAVKLIKDTFNFATEVNIGIGDGFHLCIITEHEIKEEMVELRKD